MKDQSDQKKPQGNDSFKDLEFFIDVFTHDVSSQLMITFSCLEELRFLIDKENIDGQFFLHTAIQSVTRSQMVIDQAKLLSSMNDLTNGDYSPIDLCGVIKRSITTILDMFPKEKIKINTKFKRKPSFVQGTTILDNCLNNLLQNAVLADHNSVKRIDVILDEVQEHNQWKIEVIDHGEGIPDDLKSKIFERFFRARSSKGGSGLGLHIVKTIIERLGGEIGVTDRVKGDFCQGSKFIIKLPRIDIPDFPDGLESQYQT